jgi:cytochrome b
MTSAKAATGFVRVVQVWDLPTRLFHWALVGLVAAAWFTGEGEGGAAAIHRYSGEAIAGLIVFRVAWGFVGGERARFSDFAAGPAAIVEHVRNLFSRTPARHLGHNPLGGLAVFLLLLNVAALVVTGLFSGGHDNAGPFAGLWGLQLSELHEVLFRALQGLTVVHVAGVAIESWRSKDALVPAMITGSKRRTADEPGGNARRASLLALFAAVALGVAASAVLMTAPPSTFQASGIGAEHPESD